MMLLKQQYEQALSRVITDDYYFTKDIYDKDKASVFDKDVDMLEQLIETYFEIVEKLCKYFNCKNEEELKNIYLCKPYKAKDLKAGMYVWDEKPDFEEFRIFKIEKILTEKDCEYLYRDKNKKVFIDNMTNHAREFEEGRFFPLTKGMQGYYEISE